MSASSVLTKPSRGPHTVGVPQSRLETWESLSPPGPAFAGPALSARSSHSSAPICSTGRSRGDDFEFHFVSWLNAQQSWLHGVPYPQLGTSANFGPASPVLSSIHPHLDARRRPRPDPALDPGSCSHHILLLAATGLATALWPQRAARRPCNLAGCAVLSLATPFHRPPHALPSLPAASGIPLLLLFALATAILPPRFGVALSTGPHFHFPSSSPAAGFPTHRSASWPVYLLAAVALAAALLARPGSRYCVPPSPSRWEYAARLLSHPRRLGAALGRYSAGHRSQRRSASGSKTTGSSASFQPGAEPADAELHFRLAARVSMIAVALLSCSSCGYARGCRQGRAGSPQMEAQATASHRHHAGFPWPAFPPRSFLLPVSLPVWNLLPKLRFLQFPWRWLLVVKRPRHLLRRRRLAPQVRAALARPSRGWRLRASLCRHDLRGQGTFFATTPNRRHHNFFVHLPSGAGFTEPTNTRLPSDNYSVATGLPDACLTSKFDTELGIAPKLEDNPVWRRIKAVHGTATAQCVSRSTCALPLSPPGRLPDPASRTYPPGG